MNYFSSIDNLKITKFLSDNGYTLIDVEEGRLHTSYIFFKDKTEFEFEIRFDDDTVCDTHCLSWRNTEDVHSFDYLPKRWAGNIDTTIALVALKRKLNKYNKLRK